MVLNWILPVRGLQVVLSLVVLGLMAYVSSWWTTHWRQMSPTEVNFLIFSPVWSLIALGALIFVPWKMPRMAESTMGRFGLLAVECLTMLFWFSGFIAIAVFLSDRICFGTVCSVAKAGTAISAFTWAAFAVTTVTMALKTFRGGRSMAMNNEPKVEMHQGV